MHANLAHDFRSVPLHGSGAPVLKRKIALEDIQPNDVTADAPGFLEGGPTPKITLRYVPQSHVIPQASRCNRERCIAAASSGAMSQPRHLINAGRSLPIENVNQLPRVPNEIYLQLPLLIDLALRLGVEHARALALVRVIQI